MKVFKTILLVCFTLFLYSCSTDDSTTTPAINVEAQMLVGTWNLTAIMQDGIATTPGVPLNGTITSFGKDIDAQITFTENPSNFSGTGGYTDVITVSIVGQSYTEEVPITINDVLGQGTWAVDNGELTLSQSGQIQTVKVTELTSTSLKIEVDIEESTMVEGIPVTVNSTVSMTLTKQ